MEYCKRGTELVALWSEVEFGQGDESEAKKRLTKVRRHEGQCKVCKRNKAWAESLLGRDWDSSDTETSGNE